MLSGTDAFTLHDTYGFPIELTLEMAAEADLKVDEEGFRSLMAEQRRRAKADAAARKQAHADLSAYRDLVDAGPTEFTGFDELSTEARILGIFVDGKRVPVVTHEPHTSESRVELILDRTPFYAESGGQIADEGSIGGTGASETARAAVTDVQKIAKTCGRIASPWNRASSSRATPWWPPWIRAGVTAPPRGTPERTWCTPRYDRCSAPPTPFRRAR